jgi:hypothetical protein
MSASEFLARDFSGDSSHDEVVVHPGCGGLFRYEWGEGFQCSKCRRWWSGAFEDYQMMQRGEDGTFPDHSGLPR